MAKVMRSEFRGACACGLAGAPAEPFDRRINRPGRGHQPPRRGTSRAAIARALLTKPRILLLDEPTTMLDVSIQEQILRLFLRLRAERRLGMLLISHDRALLTCFVDEIHTLDAGRVQ